MRFLDNDTRIYHVARLETGVVVTVDGFPLTPRHDLRNHSPSGFEFGYGGNGPAQLALAILADCLGDAVAQEFYQEFKWAVIARQSGNAFTLMAQEVRSAIAAIETARRAQVAQRN